jgi:hypothetical protein
MTKAWLIVVMVACGGKPPAPALEPAPAPEPSPPPPLAPDPPPDDREVGLPPVSKPRGEPIKITVVPANVGDKYRMVMTSTFVADLTSTTHQETEKAHKLDLEVLAVARGVPTKLRATTVLSSEHMKLPKADNTRAILSGTYLVTAPPGLTTENRFDTQIIAEREDGTRAGNWESEVLNDLLRDEIGIPNTYLEVARGRALRLGESIQLDAREKQRLIGADPKDDATSLTVVEHTGGLVTYHIDLSRDVAHVRLRMRFVVETATGRVRDARVTSLTNEPDGMKQVLRSVITLESR